MKESQIEKDCRVEAVAAGGLLMKWVSPGNAGVPDRILLIDKCPVVFVELKQPGEGLDPLQAYWARTLRSMGFEVWSPITSAEEFGAQVGLWVRRHRKAKEE